MKKIFLPLAILASVTLYSCNQKDDKKTDGTDTPVENTTPSSTEAGTKADNNPVGMLTVSASPDTALLGKKNQAFIRIKNLKAIALTNPEGENTGIEMTYDLEVTNRSAIGGNSVYVKPSDFRLLLDNGTKITHDNYNSVSVDAESTASSSDNKFLIPAGAKPVSLNLFFDETNATIMINLK